MPEDGQPELNGVHSGGSQPDEQGLPRNQQDGRQGRQRGPRRSQPRNSEDYSLALRYVVNMPLVIWGCFLTEMLRHKWPFFLP